MDLAITSLGVVSPFGVGRASWESALADPQGAMAAAFRSPSEVLDGVQMFRKTTPPGRRTLHNNPSLLPSDLLRTEQQIRRKKAAGERGVRADRCISRRTRRAMAWESAGSKWWKTWQA